MQCSATGWNPTRTLAPGRLTVRFSAPGTAEGFTRMARRSPTQTDFSAFTQTRPRTDDATGAAAAPTDTSWPISVNGHTVRRIEPPAAVYGANDEVAFRCIRCDELIYPPADRIDDAEWVQNRFDLMGCSRDDDGDNGDDGDDGDAAGAQSGAAGRGGHSTGYDRGGR